MNKFEAMRDQLKKGVQVVSAPQLFSTPKKIIDLMIRRAKIQPWNYVLEPSAGTGAIMAVLDPLCNNLLGIERISVLANALGERGFATINMDFLNYAPEIMFDRIVMNPPFARLQDLNHVMRAFDHCLKPGGRLVAIMSPAGFSNQNKKAKAFRSWFIQNDGQVEELPKNSFEESGTKVNSVIVVIDKGT